MRLEGRIIGKFLALPKHEDIILNSMTRTRKKWNSMVLSRADFWMVWRCHGIPYFIFIFLFRTNGKKEHLDENDFHFRYGNYFESAIMKVNWYQLCPKSFLNTYEAHWQRNLKIEDLKLKILQQWINIRANSSLVNIMKRKWAKVPGKLSVAQKSELVLWRAFHLLLYSYFSLKQT